MEREQNTSHIGPANLVLAPIIAFTVIGGAAMMIGRSKPVRRSRRAKNAAKSWTDPKLQKAVETAQRALDDARGQISSRDPREFQDEIARRTSLAAGATRESLAPIMKDAGELGREIVERLRVEGQIHSADLNERLRSDVAPKAKTMAQEAIDEAEEILEAARKRAIDLSDTARSEYGPEIAHGISAMGSLVAAGMTAGVQLMRDRSTKMNRRGRTQRAKREVAKGRKKTTATLQTAGGQMKYVATESLMVTFWAAACASVVYFVVLSGEQRDRIRRFFSGAVSQIQDVVSDFNDVGEEFQTRA